MNLSKLLAGVAIFTTAMLLFSIDTTNAEPKKEATVRVQYLEYVTTEAEKTCEMLEKQHGVEFGEPVAGLGNARTAALKSGGMIAVRAPLADHDKPVVRAYTLVPDIEAALKVAKELGAKVMLPATPVPGHGKFAIYGLGGVQHGVWELSAKKK